MAKAKTNKSIAKRIRVTGTGKMLRRPMGVNHFKTRKNGKAIQKKRGTRALEMTMKRLANIH